MSVEMRYLLMLLNEGRDHRDPNPGRNLVTDLDHALQAAALAELDGAPVEHVVMALVHDGARPVYDQNHAAIMAEIMRDRLPPDCVEAIRHHSEFQFDMLHGTRGTVRWALEPWFELGRKLAEWDGAAYDPDFRAPPLSHFEPMLETVLSGALYSGMFAG
jgi:predicted HD phosphohydrolase